MWTIAKSRKSKIKNSFLSFLTLPKKKKKKDPNATCYASKLLRRIYLVPFKLSVVSYNSNIKISQLHLLLLLWYKLTWSYLREHFILSYRFGEKNTYHDVRNAWWWENELATLQAPSGDRIGCWLFLFTFLFSLCSSPHDLIIHGVNVLLS